MIAPVKRRLQLLITRGVVKLINDSLKLQEMQVTGMFGEVLDGVERIQQYGFTAHPHPDADCLILNVGANRAHPIVIAVDDRRYRIQSLAEGEVAMYTDEDGNGGHRIHFKRGNIIELTAGASSIVMTPAGITITTPQFDLVKG